MSHLIKFWRSFNYVVTHKPQHNNGIGSEHLFSSSCHYEVELHGTEQRSKQEEVLLLKICKGNDAFVSLSAA